MIPQIIDITETEEGFFYLTSSGSICASFCILNIDVEVVDGFEAANSLEFALRQIPEKLIVRFSTSVEVEHNDLGSFSRSSDIAELGYTKKNTFIHFEILNDGFGLGAFNLLKSYLFSSEKHPYVNKIAELAAAIPFEAFAAASLKLIPAKLSDIQSFFPHANWPGTLTSTGIGLYGKFVGIIKLVKLGTSSVSYLTLAEKMEKFPQPFQIVTSLKRMSPLASRATFERRQKQERGLQGRSSQEKSEANDDALADVENRGEVFFYIEMHVIIKRDSESELLKHLRTTELELAAIAQFKVESPIGALTSYLSTLPGSPAHIAKRVFEKDRTVPCFLPIFSRGNANDNPPSRTALAVHRFDYSLDYFDMYDPKKTNSIFTIIGQSGRGKSVCQNLIIRAIANDPHARLIMVDVKGSHTRTMLDLGGRIHNIRLDKPSQLNPFKYLVKYKSEDGIEIIKTFLIELLLESGEAALPIKECYYLEEALMDYVKSNSPKPSLHDFIEFVFPQLIVKNCLYPDFPRKEHLLRFSSRGINKNMFSSAELLSESPLDSTSNSYTKLQYFNIDEVMQAANKTVAKATMAAIMADFSYQLLSKGAHEKLVFMVDEAPFYVKECQASFSLLCKNVRKLFGSLGLAAQDSADLTPNGDNSLIKNAETHLLFSVDRPVKEFAELFSITASQVELISKLTTVIGEYSQFFMKDSRSAKVGHLIITNKEYWNTTSNPRDLELLNKVQSVLPGVQLNDVAALIAKSQTH